MGLMHDLPDSFSADGASCKRTGNRFSILTDTVIGGYALQTQTGCSEQSDIAGIPRRGQSHRRTMAKYPAKGYPSTTSIL